MGGTAGEPKASDKKAFKPFPMWCDWVIMRRRGPPKPKTKIAAKPKAAPSAAPPTSNTPQLLREAAQENSDAQVPAVSPPAAVPLPAQCEPDMSERAVAKPGEP